MKTLATEGEGDLHYTQGFGHSHLHCSRSFIRAILLNGNMVKPQDVETVIRRPAEARDQALWEAPLHL